MVLCFDCLCFLFADFFTVYKIPFHNLYFLVVITLFPF
nr:MAG TPA: YfzA-like protein [Caudoviricetes sp.]